MNATRYFIPEFDQEMATTRRVLERVPGDKLAWKPHSKSMGGERTIFTLPRWTVFRAWGINHVVHHRAQLSVYLRLLDVPVPGIYGPSADEQ